KRSNGGKSGDGFVEKRVRTFLVRADVDQIFGGGIRSQKLAKAASFFEMFGGTNRGHQAAQAIEDGNGRVVALRMEPAIENHVAVEEGSHGIDQRILLIVALHQDGVKSGDASSTEISSTLNEPRQKCKDGRSVPFRGWRFACRETDFSLGHGETRKRIDDEEYAFASGRKILGKGSSRECCADS